MSHNDYQMALLLQQQFEHEANIDNPSHNLVYSGKKSKHAQNLNQSKSLTDPSWELIDPTPNIHILFMAFNEKYFWSKLLAVCVDWSKRMTTCAGICSYQGRGGLCRITLSEPLLKLRPRKDLIETLLHEMIHAYLFVTDNNRDRDGHGPEFHKHMYRINAEAGTNITVYHDFHDEVRLYKQHWWRCNGPCQTQKPYFGMVRRATNRAPGPNDRWWAEHESRCGGTFVKVKEPEKPQKKKAQKGNAPVSPKNDIRNFYPVIGANNSSSSLGSSGINSKPNLNASVNGFNSLFGSAGGATNRVTGFKDLNGTKPKNAVSNSSSTIVINKKPTKTKQGGEQLEQPKSNQVQPPSVSPFSGAGQVLGSRNPSDNGDYAAVRNHWLSKFSNAPAPTKRASPNNCPDNKRAKTGEVNGLANRETKAEVIDLNLHPNEELVSCPICQKKLPVSQVNGHLDQCLEQQASGPPKIVATKKCPVCEHEVDADRLERHLEDCLLKVFAGSDDVEDFKSPQELISCLVCNKRIAKHDLNTHLDECMGDNIFNNSDDRADDECNFDADVKGDDANKKYNCPVCFKQFPISEMGSHLDACLVNEDEASNGDGVLNSFLEEDFVL